MKTGRKGMSVGIIYILYVGLLYVTLSGKSSLILRENKAKK